MVGEDEVIDEFGNPWNPQDHPIRDEKIEKEPLGVSINIDGVAKIFRLGPQETEFEICFVDNFYDLVRNFAGSFQSISRKFHCYCIAKPNNSKFVALLVFNTFAGCKYWVIRPQFYHS